MDYFCKKTKLSKAIIEAEVDYRNSLSNVKKLSENYNILEAKINTTDDEERKQMLTYIKNNTDILLKIAEKKAEELKSKFEERDRLAVKFMMLSKRILSKDVYETILSKARELDNGNSKI